MHASNNKLQHNRNFKENKPINIKEFNPSSSRYEDPETIEQVETLITIYPNSSKAWMLFMVYYLKQAEIDKARAVAYRALQVINYREEIERLNMWLSLLNLENLYGTESTLKETFKKALNYNDQKKIYLHMLDLYNKSDKSEEIEKLSATMIKKFKNDKDIWINLGLYYIQSGKAEESQNILKRCLQNINKKEHADVLGKFAQMEYKYGDPEKSMRLFEDILMNYPKRKDLKSIYVNILKDKGDNERADFLSNYL